jgi:glycosyltransferase involved in cell wall biosynthesis
VKILTLNYEYPPIGGGAAPVAKVTCEALADRGHKLTVVTMGYKRLPSYEKVNGVEIYRVPCLRTKAAVCYPWEQFTYIISAKKFLKKHLKENQYDVCHTHFIIPTGVIARWLKKWYNTPYVITSHGSDVPGYNQKRFKLLHKLLHRSWCKICVDADKIVFPSQYLCDLLRKSIGVENHVVIPNGININVYRTGPKENIILTMSRLQPYKGVQRVIQAFARINPSDWTLHIAGDGPYRENLESLVSELDLTDKVVFHGWLENMSEVHIGLLAKARVSVLASDFENMPTSVMEAIASDCHVILSDIPAHQYFIRFGAELFQTDDLSTLVVKIQQAMTMPVSVSLYMGEISINTTIDVLEGVLTVSVNKEL